MKNTELRIQIGKTECYTAKFYFPDFENLKKGDSIQITLSQKTPTNSHRTYSFTHKIRDIDIDYKSISIHEQ